MPTTFTQNSEQFLAALDAEIGRLQQMRDQIAGALGTSSKPTGRPTRRGMSEEGRRRIAEAQKARWAKQKRAAKRAPAKKVAAKKTVTKKAAASA